MAFGGPFRRAVVLTAFGVLPALLTVWGLWIGSIAWDFHHELYPQARLMLEGGNPYPEGAFEPLVGNNHVWPPAAAALAAPFTILSPHAADLAFALLGLGCMGLSLWVVGVRDWRVFGVVALWPPVLVEPGLSHLTPAVMLVSALAWRARASRYQSGLWIGLGIALKLFVWPLAVWLWATGRRRAAGASVTVAAVSLLAVMRFTGLYSYVHAVRRVSAAYDQDSYTLFGLVVQAGGSENVAHAITLVVSAALLWGTWRYGSFSLAIAAALVASPIVWLDYYALAAVPLAITRPRLSAAWLVPLATAGAAGAGWKIGDTLDIVRVFAAFGVVLGLAFHAERALRETDDDEATPSRAAELRTQAVL
jgi:hypothetical protein